MAEKCLCNVGVDPIHGTGGHFLDCPVYLKSRGRVTFPPGLSTDPGVPVSSSPAPAFTPGPWKVVSAGSQVWIRTEDSGRAHYVAEVLPRLKHDPVNPADARLIAAAPELLAVLQSVLAHADDPNDDGQHWIREDRPRVVAAIAKAVRA